MSNATEELKVRSEDELFEDYYANNKCVKLNAAEVKAKAYMAFNPGRVDCIWNEDHSECTIKELKWWDDASYIEANCI